MKLKEIIYKNEYKGIINTEEIEFSKISTKPCEIDSETVFVVLKGISFNANKIIDYILSKQPCAVICEDEAEISETEIPVLRVESTRRILPFLYSRFCGINYEKFKFIGVTGTNGKTSTATMILHMLSYSGKSCGFIGTGKIESNGRRITDTMYSMTTPDPEILYPAIKEMENDGCEYIVMEVSSHALHFDKVLPIKFDISLFTNLSDEHMDFHINTENYFLTKMKLFKQSRLGIFNMDDDYSRRAYMESENEKSSVGIIHDADIMARDIIQNGLSGSEYIYREAIRLFKVCLKLPGVYNIYNSLMALCAVILSGVRPCVAKEGIKSLMKIDGRLEAINSDITVIIDYAHTAQALKNLLKTINESKGQNGRLVCVFGCGGDRYKEKRPAMAKVAETYSDFVIVTSDNSRSEDASDIISDILEGFTNNEKRKVITSRKSAVENAILSADSGDIVAVIGKGHERYNIDKTGYHSFDERKIISDALEKRKRLKENNENKSRQTPEYK